MLGEEAGLLADTLIGLNTIDFRYFNFTVSHAVLLGFIQGRRKLRISKMLLEIVDFIETY